MDIDLGTVCETRGAEKNLMEAVKKTLTEQCKINVNNISVDEGKKLQNYIRVIIKNPPTQTQDLVSVICSEFPGTRVETGNAQQCLLIVPLLKANAKQKKNRNTDSVSPSPRTRNFNNMSQTFGARAVALLELSAILFFIYNIGSFLLR
jgi:hypothetical protein